MSDLTGRLSEFITLKKISISEFEKVISVSNGLISKAIRGKKSIGSDKLEKIILSYTEINPTWLLTGEGEMLLSEEKKAASPLSGKEKNTLNGGECKECEKLKEKISFLEQLLEAKNETIKAYQSKENIAADDVPSKGRNSA